MIKPHALLTIPAPELPTQLPSANLELRLLPYWKGVKHYRSAGLARQMSPQEYYSKIVANNRNPTIVNGRIAAFNTRADMYFSRIPPAITAKLWRNFGVEPLSRASGFSPLDR